MPPKDLKTGFAAKSSPLDNDIVEDDIHDTPENGENRSYDRTRYILEFAFANLFESAYVIPYIDKHMKDDTFVLMTPADAEMYEADAAEALKGKKIDRLPESHDPAYNYSFQIRGLDKGPAITVLPRLTSGRGKFVSTKHAHPALQDALKEFLYDFAIATSVIPGVQIDTRRGIIRAHDPLALFHVLRQVIDGHNEDVEDAESELNIKENDPQFPIESRSIPLPEYATDRFENCSTPERRRMRRLGIVYFHGEFSYDVAFENLPSRPFQDRAALYEAAFVVKERMSHHGPMLRLNEIEAIIRQEMNAEKSYAPNPLLNLH